MENTGENKFNLLLKLQDKAVNQRDYNVTSSIYKNDVVLKEPALFLRNADRSLRFTVFFNENNQQNYEVTCLSSGTKLVFNSSSIINFIDMFFCGYFFNK